MENQQQENKEEQIVFKKHWFSTTVAILASVYFFQMFYVSIVVWHDCSIFYLLFGIWIFIWTFVRLKNDRIILSKDSIQYRYGFLDTVKQEMLCSDIVNVELKQGLLGRRFNFGTVRVGTANSSFSMRYIANPAGVMQKINDCRKKIL